MCSHTIAIKTGKSKMAVNNFEVEENHGKNKITGRLIAFSLRNERGVCRLKSILKSTKPGNLLKVH